MTRLVLMLAAAMLMFNAALTPQHTPETARSSLEVEPVGEAPAGTLGPVTFPPGINPLTGLPAPDPAALERRPIVAKISNAPPLVRPQAGLGQADLVYEHYAEGGLTRFSAVFYGQTPARVGSIRSARLIDYDLVTMYGGLLAFSGASIGVEKVIYGWEAVEERIPGSRDVPPLLPLPPSPFADRAYKGVLYGLPLFWREADVPVPHNLFFDAGALWAQAAEDGHGQRPDLPGMAFNPAPPAAHDGSARAIDLRYRATRVGWAYDEAAGLYWRFADGQGHFDAGTGAQISAANVIVLFTPHRLTDIEESRYGDSVTYGLEILFNDRGPALLFRDGVVVMGEWRSPATEDIPTLYTPEGALLPLRPGITWYQVMPPPEAMDSVEEWVRWEP